MNANEMAIPGKLRLDRIKLVSRIAKYVCFAVLIFSIGFFLWPGPHLSDAGRRVLFLMRFPFIIVMQIGLWFWFRKLARLPRFQGHVPLILFTLIIQGFLLIGDWKLLGPSPFSNKSWYGLLMILFQFVIWFWYWKLARLFHFYEQGRIFAAETIRCIKALGLLCVTGWLLGSALHFLPAPRLHQPVPLPVGATLTRVTHYQMGFFSFDFGTGVNFGLLFIGFTIVLVAWIMEEGRKIQEEQALTV